MSDESNSRNRRRRISLTRTDLNTEAGTELLAFCQSATADGRLSDEEIHSLRRWVGDHAELAASHHLALVLDAVLADGLITDEERKAIYLAIEAILPPEFRALVKERRVELELAAREQRKREREEAVAAAKELKARNRPVISRNFMVAGVPYEGRGDIVKAHVRIGATAYLKRDPENRYSRNAIEIRTAQGYQVGYVPELHALDLAPLLDHSAKHSAVFTKVLGRGRTPIPVVQVSLYHQHCELPDLVADRDVPIAAPVKLDPKARGCAASFALILGALLAVLTALATTSV